MTTIEWLEMAKDMIYEQKDGRAIKYINEAIKMIEEMTK